MSRQANVDKIVLGELTANLLGPSGNMVAKMKLVNSANGVSYGSMTIQPKSPLVHKKFAELKQLLEEEAEALFFENGEMPSRSTAATAPGGLGEFLVDDIGQSA